MSKSFKKVTKVATLGLVDTKGPKAPATPNYSQLATQQANDQQKIAEYLTGANRPNQVDAMGNSVTWSKDPTTGQWTQKQKWNQDVKDQYRNQTANANKANDLYKSQLGKLEGQKDFKAPDMPNMDKGLLAKGSADYDRYLNEIRRQGDFKSSAMPTYTQNNEGKRLYDKALSEAQNQGAFTYDKVPTYDERNGKAVSDATYNLYRSRALPEQQRRQSALDSQLRLQGLQPGSEAYNRAMQNMMTSNADADYSAAQSATLAGYDEARQRYMSQLQGQGQAYDQSLAAYQLPWEKLNAAQSGYLSNQNTGIQQYLAKLQGQEQGFQQDLAKYQMPWDKLNAMQQSWMQNRESGIQQYLAQLQGQGQKFGQKLTEHQLPWQQAQIAQGLASDRYMPQMPGFSGATGYNPADQIGAANAKYQAQMGQYNAQNQKKGQTLGAGASVGAALLSDEELKDNITKLDGEESLRKLLEIGGYSWTWKDNGLPDVGVIAQNVQKVMSNLINTEEPYLRVNYTGLVGMCIAALGYLAEVSNADV